MLRLNQSKAIESSIENNFQSGVHFHATGTGKSWIAMNLIYEYNQRYPKNNILWVCEKKSILIEQFHPTNIKERKFQDILKNFNVLNFTENKLDTWYNSVNASKFWSKPALLIINRAFLTSNNNYNKIKLMFYLIIHDECHTLNKSTKDFYEYIKEKNKEIKIIGFSATPNLEYKPFDNVISSYSIYDAFLDNVIVRPKIKWLTYDTILNHQEMVTIMKYIIDTSKIYHKKIIVWCGMIELCIQMAKLWQRVFENYLICVDTSKDSSEFKNYEDFYKAESNAILFCANKHREGSDIKNLDCCIFLDKVQNRCPKLFIQCIGRVLRLNKNKEFGLIIDIRAKNSYHICNNINSYLQLKENIYPWKYKYEKINVNNCLVKINTLDMIKCENNTQVKEEEEDYSRYTIEDLKKMFVRTLPYDDENYYRRLEHELDLLSQKNLICYLIQAIDIMKLTKNIPHVTRGSCGSSLVCYLLGISHVDPVKYNIKFARFLNVYRNNLPDIDLDFPHNLRDEVFLKIQLKWPNKVARISNHVHFHEKSAIRQAIRNVGIRKFIGKNDIQKELTKLSPEVKQKVIKDKENLENTFRCYSLHCGGIVYFSEGVPQNLVLNKENSKNKTNMLQQISLNKYDIAKEKNFKIDILSSRALSQCYEINNYKAIPFELFHFDEKTFKMLHKGDNIGIILGESPLMKKAFIKIKPKNIYDLAICLSIIRPAAKDASKCNELGELNENIIFDDDAIDMIAKDFNITDAEADNYRRGFTKGCKETINKFKNIISHLAKEKQKEIMKKFSNLSRYGFCKSHALSYAQLIYKLAYMKANDPKKFWESTLNNCVSSYKKWVHLYEAKLAEVDIYQIKSNQDISIYASNRRKKLGELSLQEQMIKYGYWDMKTKDFFPNCYLKISKDNYEFNGIIASIRIKINKPEKGEKKEKDSKRMMIFIGVGTKRYIQVNISKIKNYNKNIIGIKGKGIAESKLNKECDIVEVTDYIFY
jgi:superfamily II DNA or RNA helicase